MYNALEKIIAFFEAQKDKYKEDNEDFDIDYYSRDSGAFSSSFMSIPFKLIGFSLQFLGSKIALISEKMHQDSEKEFKNYN